jgi:hypothetical protein
VRFGIGEIAEPVDRLPILNQPMNERLAFIMHAPSRLHVSALSLADVHQARSKIANTSIS